MYLNSVRRYLFDRYTANLDDYHVFYLNIFSMDKNKKWEQTKDKVEEWLKTEEDLEYDAFKRNKGMFLIKIKVPTTIDW